MNYYIYGYTDKGQYRLNNEDAMLVNRVTVTKGGYGSVCIAPFLAAVCDGVGGEKAGELASQICTSSLAQLDYDSSVDLDSYLLSVHRKVIRAGVSANDTVNMQTTLCMLAVDEDGTANCYNVGDSRMYRYVNGSIRQLTTDQTYSRFLYDHGEITSVADLEPEFQNAIVSSIGSVLQEPDIDHLRFMSLFGEQPDDTVLICSDGLSDFITKDEFEIAMKITSMTFAEKLEALCQLAMRNGSTDNVSIVGIKPWNTPEEYQALTGNPIYGNKDEASIKAQQECLAYEVRFRNAKLREESEDSLAGLFADLEKFRDE